MKSDVISEAALPQDDGQFVWPFLVLPVGTRPILSRPNHQFGTGRPAWHLPLPQGSAGQPLHLMCGLLNDTWGDATIMLPDLTGDEVEQLLQFLYGKLTVVERPGHIYSCLGFSGDRTLQVGGFGNMEVEEKVLEETLEVEAIEGDLKLTNFEL